MAWGLCGVGIGKAERAERAPVHGSKAGLVACVAGAGAGGLAGHAVNPSLEARGRHPWRPTVPPTHPHRHLDVDGPVTEIKARQRYAPTANPDPSPTPHHHQPNESKQHTRTRPQHQHDTAEECEAEPAVDLRCAPTLYGGAGMGGFAGPSSAWMRWRSLQGRTCSVPRGPTHASALPDAGTPNLILLLPWLQPLPREKTNHPPQRKKRPRFRNRFFVYCICTADFLW